MHADLIRESPPPSVAKLHMSPAFMRFLASCLFTLVLMVSSASGASPRTRVLINEDWRFVKQDPAGSEAKLGYGDVKSWVLPTGNAFLKDPAKYSIRPDGNVGNNVVYTRAEYDDSSWRRVDLPHDYAVEGPFTNTISGSTGRLSAPGVVWYRKNLKIPASDKHKSIFLEIDGAMSYSMVWINGRFAGGWPYGYASYRLNLTPYVNPGGRNVLAIRLDNPVPKDAVWRSASSRWYPGAGLYRNVWLVKTESVHIGHWGTYIMTPDVSSASASISLKISLENDSKRDATVTVATHIFEIDRQDRKVGRAVASIARAQIDVPAGANAAIETRGTGQGCGGQGLSKSQIDMSQ